MKSIANPETIPLGKDFADSVAFAIRSTWAIISADVDSCSKAQQLELVLDADRMAGAGYGPANEMVRSAIKEHGYRKVSACLVKHVAF